MAKTFELKWLALIYIYHRWGQDLCTFNCLSYLERWTIKLIAILAMYINCAVAAVNRLQHYTKISYK